MFSIVLVPKAKEYLDVRLSSVCFNTLSRRLVPGEPDTCSKGQNLSPRSPDQKRKASSIFRRKINPNNLKLFSVRGVITEK